MKFGIAYLSLACALVTSGNNNGVAAFSLRTTATPMTTKTISTTSMMIHNTPQHFVSSSRISPSSSRLSMSSRLSTSESSSTTDSDDEITRLRAMAQKLRSEAASLEAEQAEERANVAKLAFEKFDKDSDGNISLKELKLGLEASLKTEVSEERVQKLMDKFDVSGDEYLQLEEMVSVDQFRNQLEAFSREEKRIAKEKVQEAQQEEEASRLAEAKLAVLNEKEPTQTDKIVSVLPYLLPLFDSLQFGRHILIENGDNPLVGLLGLVYTAYMSIPFSGFVAYLALNTLSNNPGLNKLVRFNMKQAIYMDVALFFPSLLTALIAGVGSVAGFEIPQAVNEAGSTAIFVALLLTAAYASTSSLLGIKPDKIPIISQAVEDRMPTLDMFDDEGRFIPRQEENKEDDNKD